MKIPIVQGKENAFSSFAQMRRVSWTTTVSAVMVATATLVAVKDTRSLSVKPALVLEVPVMRIPTACLTIVVGAILALKPPQQNLVSGLVLGY
jgi:hypothetical protein